jgi:hypothetical protein
MAAQRSVRDLEDSMDFNYSEEAEAFRREFRA